MILLSGGVDSATSAFLIKREYEISAVTFLYHKISTREVGAAKAIAVAANIENHRLFDLHDLKESSEIEWRVAPVVPASYIPLRNSIFYSIAGSFAEEIGAHLIVGGHNADDTKVFRDAGDHFFEQMQATLRSASGVLASKGTRILRPLKSKTKPQVVRLAERIGVPLALTWSCHRDGEQHCWGCEGCRARIEAFDAAGVSDPLRSSGKFHKE